VLKVQHCGELSGLHLSKHGAASTPVLDVQKLQRLSLSTATQASQIGRPAGHSRKRTGAVSMLIVHVNPLLAIKGISAGILSGLQPKKLGAASMLAEAAPLSLPLHLCLLIVMQITRDGRKGGR